MGHANEPVQLGSRNLDTCRFLGSYRVSVSALAKLHSPRSANFRWVNAGLVARLGGPRQCLRVDILPDVLCRPAISNGNGEDDCAEQERQEH